MTSDVDRTKIQLAGGGAVTPDHREIRPDGQQKGYVVLSPEERARGFVEPVRRSYVHTVCGAKTTMALAIAETYARDPGFYTGTFCCGCGAHYPLAQFVWDGTDQVVGSVAPAVAAQELREPKMAVMQQVPGDDPLMVAWNRYKETEAFANTKRWSTVPQHVDGTLWAAFVAGFRAAQPVPIGEAEKSDASAPTGAKNSPGGDT
jgi:hypothetical protein